jgi:Concanavalin A-like lectin/glucanases superfamily
MTGDLGTDLPGGNVPRTIELWAKFLGAQSWTAEHTIIETGYRPTTGTGNMLLGIDMSGDMDANAPRQFGPYTNGFSDNNRPGGVVVPGIAQTGWFHLSWSYSGTALSFTVDGVEYPVITQGGTPTMAFTAGIVTLGASQNFGFPGWAGVMDEVRIWRVARTPAQILANMRVVLKPTEPGLAAYYRFSEGTGTLTNDESMTVSHQLATCTAMSTRCHAVNTASPMWVASDLPGTFTCAP